MQIVEFSPGTLRFVETLPQHLAAGGFLWVFLEQEQLAEHLPGLQKTAQALGGSALLDLHCSDLANEAHPSHYDYTSVYDLVIFRRLTSAQELAALQQPVGSTQVASEFRHIGTRAVGFALFDRLLVSVHQGDCIAARLFIERYLADALHSESVSAAARSRLPGSPSDLMLRMINVMVDSYLDLRKQLSTRLDAWQAELLNPSDSFNNWPALMAARSQLHTLEDLCEEQHDAMQEWLDMLREQPLGSQSQIERDGLIARSRDVIEHIERVVHHVRRLEQGAETAVQIYFGAQSNRTNEIMRTLTALTAVFLPLNLIAGIFGMNFEFLPLIHQQTGFWWAMASMLTIALSLVGVFWRKHYIARTSDRP